MAKKGEIFKVKSVPVDPEAYKAPVSGQDYINRGMAYYARKSYDAAERDLLRAISLDPNSIEAHYRLGMVYKAVNRKDEAVGEFTKVVEMLDTQDEFSPSKNEMMHRLALGHVNEITQGDWNLEKEIWKHV